MGGGARAVLLLHSFFQVTEFNKLGVKLLVLSALNTEGGSLAFVVARESDGRTKQYFLLHI